MKAAYLTGHGGNEVVAVGEHPRPERHTGEVLVRLRAATVNRVDLYMRDSGAGITHSLPMVMGLDGAGVVEEIDTDERTLRAGQHVLVHPGIACGRCEFCLRGDDTLCTSMHLLGEHRDGTFAEFVSLPARNVFAMPEGLSFGEAAALGVNHITAWRMLHGKARVKPWETVLIFGIGGGVSLAALQLARLAGARTLVTSRDPAKLERALALGADVAIDDRGDVVQRVMAATDGRGVDVVIENVGAAVWSAALKSLVRGGRLVVCGATTGDQPPADIRRIFIRQLQILGSTMGDLGEFRDLLSLVQRSGLKPVIDSEYALNDVYAALDRLESGRQFGKVVINIGSDA